jgi:hypothetical protein
VSFHASYGSAGHSSSVTSGSIRFTSRLRETADAP